MSIPTNFSPYDAATSRASNRLANFDRAVIHRLQRTLVGVAAFTHGFANGFANGFISTFPYSFIMATRNAPEHVDRLYAALSEYPSAWMKQKVEAKPALNLEEFLYPAQETNAPILRSRL